MEEFLEYIELYDLYKNLLTEKQRSTFKDYFFENLTIEEIAENNKVSKNAISKTIKNIKSILEDSENKINLKKYITNIKKEFKDEDDILRRISKYDIIVK